MWEIEITDEYEQWWKQLPEEQQFNLDQRLEMLAQQGPALGRPAVDTLSGSKIANLKELRAGSVRVLFLFDPRRVAILLLGGDKRGQWNRWYDDAIPEAERIYAEHLARLKEGGHN